jgi:hypothetical protein
MTSARVAMTVSWGDVPLAHTVVAVPCRLREALRDTSVRVDIDATLGARADGSVVFRDGAGCVLARVARGESAHFTLDGLTFQLEIATRAIEPVPPAPADRSWLRVLATVACAVLTLCTWLAARPPLDVSDRDRFAALSHLVARATARHLASPPRESSRPSTSAPDDGPSEPLPDTRLVRVDTVRSWMHAPSDASDATRAVATRGVLGLTTMTPQLARALRNTMSAFASMHDAPIEGVTAADDRVRYGSMTAGVGAGAGCPPGVDCDPVAVHVSVGDRWRPRAATLAHAAMQARTTSAPLVHAAPPEMGELTMAYVQHRIRRDLLADVQRCYNDRLAQTPDLPSGRVVVRFEVSTDGSVRDAAIASTAIAQPGIEQCITRVLGDAHFPTSETGARVTYPFVFSSLVPDR